MRCRPIRCLYSTQSTEREIGTAIEMVEVEEGARTESFSAVVPAQEASVGEPQRMIEMVKARCGTG